jgi:Flp pilus assembly protein TadG
MSIRRGYQRGASLIEAAMFIPFVILLLLGMMEFGRITYTYFQLQKVLYAFARYAGTQQAINFCDPSSDILNQAITLARTGTSDSGAESVVLGLQAADFRVRIERYNPATDALEECDCSSNGCDVAQGGGAPNFIYVDFVNGYPVVPRIPLIPQDPIVLRPRVRLPFGGT